VDEDRSPRTRATVNQLLDRYLEVIELEPTTRQGYVGKIDKHIRPTIGALQVGRLGTVQASTEAYLTRDLDGHAGWGVSCLGGPQSAGTASCCAERP
jgi:hypothetical protein